MIALKGFAVLLCAQAAGEVLARFLQASFGWTLPGPVWGMLLLCLALLVPWVQATMSEAIGAAAQTLLTHLSLLFVPVGVGVVVHLELLSVYGGKLIGVLLISTWLGLAVTALVLRARWPQGEAMALGSSADKGSAPIKRGAA
jgi:holin-like protein